MSSILSRSLTNFSIIASKARFGNTKNRDSGQFCAAENARHPRNPGQATPGSGLLECMPRKGPGRWRQSIVPDLRFNFVACQTEQLGASRTEVLIELESHAALLPGRST
jgi:hypothetical protein